MSNRFDKARKLFGAWTGVTKNDELVSAMWNALEPEEKQVWLDRVDADAAQ